MSFGFSISDFVCLARLASQLHRELARAPGICESFREELFLFHRVLAGTARELEGKDNRLEESDKIALREGVKGCENLLYKEIGGIDDGGALKLDNVQSFPLKGFRQRWASRKLATKIPHFQQAISARIQALTAFHVLNTL